MTEDNKPTLSRRQALMAGAVAAAFAGSPAFAQSGAIAGTIQTGREGPALNPFLYGGFLEHIGDLINHSLWSEVLDHDAYYWFRENGGMTRKNGQRFREMILSRGGTDDAAALFRAFRGRDPVVEPLLIERGLKPGKEK